jgi:hypothetical protein
MQFLKKIDLKVFIPYSLATTLVFSFFLNGTNEILVLFVVYIATLINLALLVNLLMKMFELKLSGGEIKPLNIITMFILKLIIMFTALTWGIHLVGNRIIIPLLNYILQILILTFAMRRTMSK